jgi:regulator of replication initiation timing
MLSSNLVRKSVCVYILTKLVGLVEETTRLQMENTRMAEECARLAAENTRLAEDHAWF